MKINYSLLFAILLVWFTSANAEGMKCGAGKCGAAMMQQNDTTMKAIGCNCHDCDNQNCAAKKDSTKPCDCNHDSKQESMKCGSGKCGSAPKGAPKCG
jgi:hypothetical protein